VNEGWLERAGVRLHYLEWQPESVAREPALFLLHGLGSNARVWERLAARLPARQIVALDQRSHGRSDRPADGYTTAELTADAAHAIDVLGLGRPVVAGHSWGATVALALAAGFPDLVSGLVIVDGPVAAMSASMTWEEAARRMQPPLPTYPDLDAAVAAQVAYLTEAWDRDLDGFVEAGLVRTDGGYTSTLTAPVRLQILRALYDERPEPLFPAVEGPVLLALAGRTWAGAPASFAEWKGRSAQAARAIRPDAQLRWYDSPHDIPLARPVELAADVERTALAAGFWDVARRVSALDGEWSRAVHGDQDGWTARDLLAHLSSTQAALPRVVTARPSPGGEPAAPFESDRWNASQLRRRMDAAVGLLQAELRDSAVRLQAALMDADVSRVAAAGAYAGRPLDEALDSMADHQRGHLRELAAALSLPV
jgi:pimeloyl-ACP methyl ester carboxylesterase